MVYGKNKFFAKWRFTAVVVGFLTLVYVASVHAEGSEYIYWTEAGASNKIRRANLDGTGVQDLITGVSGGRGIALDLTNNHIYWAELGSGKIRRAKRDGTGVETDRTPRQRIEVALCSTCTYENTQTTGTEWQLDSGLDPRRIV